MAVTSVEHADLFEALAVHFQFVSSDVLAGAMTAWRDDQHRAIGDILCEQGHLSPERLNALSDLVDDMVRRHGESIKSLAGVRPTKPDATPPPPAAVSLDPDVVKTRAQAFDRPPSSQTSSASRYRILKPHKKGGLGEVFVAEDTELGRRVALKEIQNRFAHDGDSRTRFVLEAEVTGGLEHPGIVPVYGLSHYSDGRPYYAMRFVQGDNLRPPLGPRRHAGGEAEINQYRRRPACVI